jgi:hypothetical protein
MPANEPVWVQVTETVTRHMRVAMGAMVHGEADGYGGDSELQAVAYQRAADEMRLAAALLDELVKTLRAEQPANVVPMRRTL